MKTRFKSNDFVAILIAIILFAIGFALLFMHEQSTNKTALSPGSGAVLVITEPITGKWI